MSMYEGSIHFLRSYGKYSKIITEGFNNPKLINKTLYANEKFRHHNATQYIQALPQEGTDEFRIHFSW